MFRAIAVLVLGAALIAGCAENEETIYVEHVKVQPSPPDCEFSSGDSKSFYGTLDLAFQAPFTTGYLITNTLIARENSANVVAESNGVIIEGMEAYVRGLDGSLVGTTEYYEFEFYFPPDSSEVAYAVALPASVVGQLALPGVMSAYGCPPLSRTNYPDAAFSSPDLFPWLSSKLGTVYSEVRFLGHTQGGVDVETPLFTYPIDLCCGCLVNWISCMDPCARYCQEPEPSGMCIDGVSNGGDPYDCRAIYYDPENATWSDPDCVVPNACTCDDDCEG